MIKAGKRRFMRRKRIQEEGRQKAQIPFRKRTSVSEDCDYP